MSDETKKGGTFALILAIFFFLLAISTLIPYKNIDDVSFLGYKALCAFTPISTIILILVGIVMLIIRQKVRK
jgi:hypothetical protein